LRSTSLPILRCSVSGSRDGRCGCCDCHGAGGLDSHAQRGHVFRRGGALRRGSRWGARHQPAVRLAPGHCESHRTGPVRQRCCAAAQSPASRGHSLSDRQPDAPQRRGVRPASARQPVLVPNVDCDGATRVASVPGSVAALIRARGPDSAGGGCLAPGVERSRKCRMYHPPSGLSSAPSSGFRASPPTRSRAGPGAGRVVRRRPTSSCAPHGRPRPPRSWRGTVARPLWLSTFDAGRAPSAHRLRALVPPERHVTAWRRSPGGPARAGTRSIPTRWRDDCYSALGSSAKVQVLDVRGVERDSEGCGGHGSGVITGRSVPAGLTARVVSWQGGRPHA
jgi:hypothetical protein